MDVEIIERVEAEIDICIKRRTREARDANAIEEMWKASERRHHKRIRREHTAAWYEFEMNMCELHASLSEEHRLKAEQLLEETAGERS